MNLKSDLGFFLRTILLIFCFALNCKPGKAINVTIIESQTYQVQHAMDSRWFVVVNSMGYTPTLAPQTTLDDTLFFQNTDILIISSGVIFMPANRAHTILQFIKTGKPVYLQSEYLHSISTNIAFAAIVDSLGGTFNWTNELTGDLAPMDVIGTFATTNVAVPPLSYYWYSVAGVGDCNTSYILKKGTQYHGFQYVPSNTHFGNIITTTDQDWVNQNTSPALMKNIITHLLNPDKKIGINLTLGKDTTLCQGQSIALNAGLANNYFWSTGATSAAITATTSGTYWVRVNGSSACTQADTIQITFNSTPAANLGKDTTLCEGQTIALSAGLAASYLWSNNSTSPSISVDSTGIFWAQLSNGSCKSSDTIQISSIQNPSINLGNDTILCEGESLNLFSDTLYSNLWSNLDTTASIQVSSAGIYWLQASNKQCSTRDSITVSYCDMEIALELPNVVTPNNDGFNDNFIPIKYKGIKTANLKIYNRWGIELVNTDNLLKGWSGKLADNDCTDGTYYWIVAYTTITNKTNSMKGIVSILH